MNWKPDKIGAEPRKLAILGGLIVIATVSYFLSRNSAGSDTPTRPAGGATAVVTPGSGAILRPVSRTSRVTQNGVGNNPKEFKPSMKVANDIELASVDPTLRLNELAKLQDVKVEASARSLFEISAAPPPEVKLSPEPDKKIKPAVPFVGPMPPGPPPPPPPKPKAPPIPLKFYGFVNPARPDVKRAFFLEGEDILIAGEGDVIKKHYKILRIGVNSAEVEDIQFKGDNTKQTLPLETEGQG
jgi:hypothetical protein